MLSHIYTNLANRIRTPFIGGLMNRAHGHRRANLKARMAAIAAVVIVLAAALALAIVSPARAASLAMVPGERSGGSQVAGSTGSAGSSLDGKEKRPLGE